MIELSVETENLAREIARKKGVSVDEVIKSALAAFADKAASVHEPKRSAEDMIAGIETIARRSAARPVYDDRAADDIVGYDEFGAPR